MLTSTHFLDENQLTELDALCAECKKADGNIVAIYRHLLDKARPIACNILYYDQKRLIGFLRTFFFFEGTCEIAMMVDPAYRRRGIARQMFHEIEAYIHPLDTQTLTFSVPHGINQDWLTSLGLSYQGSEYRMHYQPTTMIQKKATNVRLATYEDIPLLCNIDVSCFPKQRADLEFRFQGLIDDPECEIFIIHQEGVPVGKTHLFWYTDGVRLTDIAVLPQAQRRGFASTLISHCIDHALAANKSDITLDVETDNKNALNLYVRLGFVVSNAHDYWNIPTS